MTNYTITEKPKKKWYEKGAVIAGIITAIAAIIAAVIMIPQKDDGKVLIKEQTTLVKPDTAKKMEQTSTDNKGIQLQNVGDGNTITNNQ